MRSARMRRAPAPPRCRRRRSSCLAPRIPRFCLGLPDFQLKDFSDKNPEIYTRKKQIYRGAPRESLPWKSQREKARTY